MNEKFIHSAKQIVLNNLQNEKFDTHSLASELGLSRSQVYRKIKLSTGKSPGRFIREIRLEEALKLMRSEDLTAAEVSYEVGFSSPQYFSKCFHEYYGNTPLALKNKTADEVRPQQKKRTQKLYIFTPILAVLITFIGYQYIVKERSTTVSVETNSITILPFEDLTEDSEKMWWCKGFQIELTNKLSLINDLIVVEGPSENAYKENQKTIPELAEDYGVKYFLEGSLRHFYDSLVIDIQLIDSDGVHIWNQEYKSEDTEAFTVQHNIATAVARQLGIELNNQEIISLVKPSTTNFEAEEYFRKAHYADASILDEDAVRKRISFLKEAIRLDPNYAMAHAYLGEILLNAGNAGRRFDTPIYRDSARNVALEYLNRAIELDSTNSYAYSVFGELYMYEKDHELSQKYFKKALSLNPNDVNVHMSLSYYYRYQSVPTDYQKFLYHTLEAYKRNPTSLGLLERLMVAYAYNGKIKKAESLFKEKGHLFSNASKANVEGVIKTYKLKDLTQVIVAYKKYIEQFPEDAELHSNVGHNYVRLLNDPINALKHVEKSYHLNPKNSYNAGLYVVLLLREGNIDMAKVILQDQIEKGVLNKIRRDNISGLIAMREGRYAEAYEIYENPQFENTYNRMLFYYKVGDSVKYYNIFRNWSPHLDRVKAAKFALTKNRDSMYYYLNKSKGYGDLGLANGHWVFDPYKNEPRFKAILKKFYFPKQIDIRNTPTIPVIQYIGPSERIDKSNSDTSMR